MQSAQRRDNDALIEDGEELSDSFRHEKTMTDRPRPAAND
jgi:hypothetical protein